MHRQEKTVGIHSVRAGMTDAGLLCEKILLVDADVVQKKTLLLVYILRYNN